MIDPMILVFLRMKVVPEKRRELSQAITSLMVSIRAEKGSRRCDLYHGMEDEDEFYLCEEWDTEKDLSRHMQSTHFEVLLGAMSLLREPYEMRFLTVLPQPQFADPKPVKEAKEGFFG